MSSPSNKMEWALRLAEQGFRILQLQAGSKDPLRGFGWLKSATSDPEVIRQWFEENPDMNYGVCPGDDHVIIDLDIKPGKNGEDYLIGLTLEHGDIGETFTVESPSGGKHLYFNTPVVLGNAHGFPKEAGIDVRGAHGYVVGPGSELIAGKCKETDTPGPYVITDDSDVIEVPEWLRVNWLREKRERDEQADDPLIPLDLPENIEKALDFLKGRPPAIEGRNGNDHTFETVAYLRDFGVSESKAAELMISSGWNDRCEPPWDFDELLDVVEHSYRYGQNRAGSKADLLSMYDRLMGDVEETELAELGETVRSGVTDHLFSPKTLTQRGKRREYVVPNWLPAHGVTALLAKRGVGKSTILLDLACRMACDMDWQGVPVKEGYVAIYLCGEDDEGIELNLSAWQKENGEIPEDRMIIADAVTNLMSAEDVRAWAETLVARVGNRKAIVILDTWQRATAFAGQNKDEDMQLCIHHAEALARSLHGPMIGAFHPPKHNEHTVHGSAVVENSTVAIWELDDAAEGGKKLRVTRIKGPGFGSYRLFTFQETEMEEHDEFGNPYKGLIPVKKGGSEDGPSAEQEALQEAREAWAWLIYGMMKVQGEKGPDEERVRPHKEGTASELNKLLEDEGFMSRYGKRAKKLGVTKLSQSAIKRRLTELFWTKHKPIVMDEIMMRLSVDHTLGRGGELVLRQVEEGEI